MAILSSKAFRHIEDSSQQCLKGNHNAKSSCKLGTDVKHSNETDFIAQYRLPSFLLDAYQVLASNPEAAAINFEPVMPEDGWQCLPIEDSTLEALLVHIGECGTNALTNARANMDHVAMFSSHVFKPCNGIYEFENRSISFPLMRSSQVTRAMESIQSFEHLGLVDDRLCQLQKISESCSRWTGDIERDLDTWLLSVIELRVASLQMFEMSEFETELWLGLKADIEAKSENRAGVFPETSTTGKNLAAMERKIKSITNDGNTLEQTRYLLASTITTILPFKQQIAELRTLFSTISSVIHLVLRPKLRELSPKEDNRLIMEMLLNTLLSIRASFELAQGQAKMFE